MCIFSFQSSEDSLDGLTDEEEESHSLVIDLTDAAASKLRETPTEDACSSSTVQTDTDAAATKLPETLTEDSGSKSPTQMHTHVEPSRHVLKSQISQGFSVQDTNKSDSLRKDMSSKFSNSGVLNSECTAKENIVVQEHSIQSQMPSIVECEKSVDHSIVGKEGAGHDEQCIDKKVDSSKDPSIIIDDDNEDAKEESIKDVEEIQKLFQEYVKHTEPGLSKAESKVDVLENGNIAITLKMKPNKSKDVEEGRSSDIGRLQG